MRYRKLDEAGDMTWGQGQANFYINIPSAVAQAVDTRLRLLEGEWFLDKNEGTPYTQQIVGKHPEAAQNAGIRDRILNTQGVLTMNSFATTRLARKLTADSNLDTVYGPVKINTAIGG